MSLPKSVLASAAFKKRLDVFNNMKQAPWGPFDYENLQRATAAARLARAELKVRR
jgi:hypothetical protein